MMAKVFLHLFVVAILLVLPAVGRADAGLSSLRDFSFGTWTGGDLTDNFDLCVYNTAASSYHIQATTNTGADFKVKRSGSNDYIRFYVYWHDARGSAGGQEMTTAGQDLPGTQDGASSSSTCNSGNDLNANVRIRFLSSDLGSAYAGTYSGTIVFTVSPAS